jgi:hypothetical protein
VTTIATSAGIRKAASTAPTFAWSVDFNIGFVTNDVKSDNFYVPLCATPVTDH